jgi:hypothetical protein
MTQAKQISALQRKLGDKTQEILANTHGVEDVASLDASQLQRLYEEIEEIIDQYDEALLENDSPEAWRALDEWLARTKIGRLLQERHEIAEQILDAEEDDEDGKFLSAAARAGLAQALGRSAGHRDPAAQTRTSWLGRLVRGLSVAGP